MKIIATYNTNLEKVNTTKTYKQFIISYNLFNYLLT